MKNSKKIILHKSHLLGLYLGLLILLAYFVVYPYFSSENINITQQVSIPKKVPTSKKRALAKKQQCAVVDFARYGGELAYHKLDAINLIKKVLVTNTNRSFYVTFNNELLNGCNNDYIDIYMTVKRKKYVVKVEVLIS